MSNFWNKFKVYYSKIAIPIGLIGLALVFYDLKVAAIFNGIAVILGISLLICRL